MAELWPIDHTNENLTQEIYRTLETLKQNKKLSGIYLKKDIPERFKIKNHKRAAPILLTASEVVN